ncbi:MAG: FG-GAP-like repeat-containing protein, partial [Verrucomicrobiota bacterium]
LEVGISFFRQKVILWPASALLTGNGVAFILRVPGTEHGDWWSLHGWWIFAGTAAVSLLSKYVIRFRGNHVFNPSNVGLVLCFLLLGPERAEPLDFWWGPMSPWMAFAVALIVTGGLAILSRLRLLAIAVAFWMTFAAGMAVLAASGHAMTARWHLGPISGREFWWLLVTSPEVLIFLFFMITDPKTIPRGRVARLVYAVGIGLLATLLIAPQTTEFATKVAVLGSLTIVCAVRPLLEAVLPKAGSPQDRVSAWLSPLARHGRLAAGASALAAAVGFAGLVVLAGVPARPSSASAAAPASDAPLPLVEVVATKGISSRVDEATASQIARDVVTDLRVESDALRLRNPERAAVSVSDARLVDLRRQVARATGALITVPRFHIRRLRLELRPGSGQGPPRIFATLVGTRQLSDYRGLPPRLVLEHAPTPFESTLEVAFRDGRYVIIQTGSGAAQAPAMLPTAPTFVRATGPLRDVRLQDVAQQVGLDFRQGAFRFGVSQDMQAMMGGGLCWLDYDGDGWLDLFVVNSYADADTATWEKRGGLPRSALFHNVGGRFVDVSSRSHADLAVKGQGCVAADLNGDGRTDLVVTTPSGDKLLWNNGDGTFDEGARAAGIDVPGWHTGAAVADVNGDGRPDLFVAGYTDLNTPVTSSIRGFPGNFEGVRDLLYLNEGNDKSGHARFREVGAQAGLEAASFRHGLGALFTDYNGDGRPDLYVANDEDPNQLYEDVAWPGGAAADPAGLGFRFEERGAAEGVADPYAGMGIASGDYNGDGHSDLFVTNSRHEPYAVLRRSARGTPSFSDGRPAFRSAASGSAGWGASWADLSLDGTPDLVLVNGAIPVASLARDAGRIQVFADLEHDRKLQRYANVGLAGLRSAPRVNGRGLAAADFDNDGTVDIAVNSVGGPLVLLRNTGETGHWLEVRLPEFAPGTVATVVLPDGRTLVQESHAGSSYLSSEDPRLHFGLGAARKVTSLVVRFPDGGERRLSNVGVDRVVTVVPPRARRTPARTVSTGFLRPGCSSALGKRSVARVWDDVALEIDPATDNPALQARNLFHLSAAMWDAWSAYEPRSTGYFLTEKHRADAPLAARDAAISYAAYRLLVWRASFRPNLARSFGRLTATMRALCYEPGFTDTHGDSPAALGNRIAAAAIAYGRRDGSHEDQHYLDPTYVPVNEPLVVSQPGSTMHDQTFWQPLALGRIVTQGGLAVPARIQVFAASQWGHVRSFALPTSKKGLPIDPGAPPTDGSSSAAYDRTALDVIRWSTRPAGSGVVSRWAGREGPGRWNEIANAVSDARERSATPATRLSWDVKLYFALNGALHDAAVATWGAKRTYQSVRPISMIRELAFQGQSSDRRAPSFSPGGLPL